MNEWIVMGIIIVIFEIIRYIPQFAVMHWNKKRKIIKREKTIWKAVYIWTIGILILFNTITRIFYLETSKTTMYCGMILYLFGISLGMLGLRNLKFEYNDEIILYKDHKIVTQGVYSIIRHPLRVSIILELTGLVIISNNMIGYFLLLCGIILLHLRTVEEEHFLNNNLGEIINVYYQNVPRYNFVTGILKKIKSRQVKFWRQNIKIKSL